MCIRDSYIAWGIAAIFAVAIVCLYSRIKLAIAVVKCAAMFVNDCWSSLVVPPVVLILVLFHICWLFIVGVYIYSIGEIDPKSNAVIRPLILDSKTKYYLYFHIFGCFWNIALSLAFCEFILASACAIWYFQRQDKPFYILPSIKRAIFNHLGSLAFGSFILAIVWTVKLWLEYLAEQSRQAHNQVTEFIFRVLSYCVSCFERFIKFLNKNAYIQIAIQGKSFCESAAAALSLMIRNAVRFGVTSGLGEIFVFIGKALITAGAAAGGYFYVTKADIRHQISSPILPTIAFIIVGYVIADLFMTVYSMSVDTVLQCFLVDEEAHDGRATNAPGDLKNILEDNQKS
eukprot:TRINITY_DN779_c0_g1_i6.p1 TRINITY_DN779_c0_g1~~TRINITY_DN779_c0_g1_i6.p1  ORF type:complete len:357 (-),score=60.90 TRINITY_DN779_c0_g1_i6:124-1155(-)